MTLALDHSVVLNFTGSTHNTSPLAIVTSGANEVLVVLVSAEAHPTLTELSVSGVADTTALVWSKLTAHQWAGDSTYGCHELWWAIAPTAGTYDITITMDATIDAASVVGLSVSGAHTAAPWDTGVTANTGNTVKTGTAQMTGITSANSDLMVIASLTNWNSSVGWVGNPATGFTELQHENDGFNGSLQATIDSQYKILSGGLSAATVGWGSGETPTDWGMLVAALTSDAPTESGTITQVLNFTSTGAVNDVGKFVLDATGSDSVGSAGAASGAATVSGVGVTQRKAAGAASGAATVSGVGESTAKSVGSASGAATVSGAGSVERRSVGSASGDATAAGVGASKAAGVGSASGQGTATGIATGAAAGVGSASGAATVSGVGKSTAKSVGSASGAATVEGVGTSTAKGVGAASGHATAAGVSASLAKGVGSASGQATVTGRSIPPSSGTSPVVLFFGF